MARLRRCPARRERARERIKWQRLGKTVAVYFGSCVAIGPRDAKIRTRCSGNESIMGIVARTHVKCDVRSTLVELFSYVSRVVGKTASQDDAEKSRVYYIPAIRKQRGNVLTVALRYTSRYITLRARARKRNFRFCRMSIIRVHAESAERSSANGEIVSLTRHFRTLSGLVLTAAARDAGALHQHIPGSDVLQVADVAASRRSGSRTRGGRDLRLGGDATLWVVIEPEFRTDATTDGAVAPGELAAGERLSRPTRSVLRVSRGLREERHLERDRREESNRRRIDFERGICLRTIVLGAATCDRWDRKEESEYEGSDEVTRRKRTSF